MCECFRILYFSVFNICADKRMTSQTHARFATTYCIAYRNVSFRFTFQFILNKNVTGISLELA